MKVNKRARLRKRGWVVGGAKEFLHLSEEEAALIELKLVLSRHLRARRQDQHLSQGDVAKLLQSSQSRVAKMEAGDPSVSVDLLIRALLRLGTTNRELARLIAATKSAA